MKLSDEIIQSFKKLYSRVAIGTDKLAKHFGSKISQVTCV